MKDITKSYNFKSIPILMYHSIATPAPNEVMRSLHVKPKTFARQMRLLKALGYTGLSIRELVPYLTGEREGRVVGLTFDDGYSNNLEVAAPILKKLGFSATCYIVTSALGADNFWDRHLGISSNPIMSELEVKIWASLGNEIGCHTHTHPSLPELSKDEVVREILTSKKTLEEITGQDIQNFCYPYGHYNDSTKEAVSSLGFMTATTMLRGKVRQSDHLLQLPRIPITFHTHLPVFLMKVLSSYEDKRRNR